MSEPTSIESLLKDVDALLVQASSSASVSGPINFIRKKRLLAAITELEGLRGIKAKADLCRMQQYAQIDALRAEKAGMLALGEELGENFINIYEQNAALRAERDALKAELVKSEEQRRHDDDADTDMRNTLCEERDEAEKQRDTLRADLAAATKAKEEAEKQIRDWEIALEAIRDNSRFNNGVTAQTIAEEALGSNTDRAGAQGIDVEGSLRATIRDLERQHDLLLTALANSDARAAAAESRADALGARVEALSDHLAAHSNGAKGVFQTSCELWSGEDQAVLFESTPEADLSAHDARIRREEREASAQKLADVGADPDWVATVLNPAPPMSEEKEGQDA